MMQAVAGLTFQDVHDFWFEELTQEDWFKPNEKVDDAITTRFAALYEALHKEVPEDWLSTGVSALAAVIVLDQFPRNMFRGSAQAFATDAQALTITKTAVDAGLDKGLSIHERQFLYLPFEHSEDPADQEQSVALNTPLGDVVSQWAVRHKDVIDRFGRFPARNKALGRETTGQEAAFLKETPMGF